MLYYIKDHLGLLISSSRDNKPCLCHSLPVAFLSRRCGLACRTCLSKCASPLYLRTLPSVSVCHALHLLSPVAPFAVASNPSTLTPRCHFAFSRLFIQRLLSQAITVFVWPTTSDPFVLCAFYIPGEFRPSDPDCLFIFPSYCKGSHTYSQGPPSIQCLPSFWARWVTYIMARDRYSYANTSCMRKNCLKLSEKTLAKWLIWSPRVPSPF